MNSKIKSMLYFLILLAIGIVTSYTIVSLLSAVEGLDMIGVSLAGFVVTSTILSLLLKMGLDKIEDK